MANLKVKKVDLKGPIEVGHGWLVTRAWAVLVGDDKRFLNVETTNAAFAGLDVAPLPQARARRLARLIHEVENMVPYISTQVLIEGEDGTLCRVYRSLRSKCKETACLPEATVGILGKPPEMRREFSFFTSPQGIMTDTTDECPPWALEVTP
jgi:hypothetical protein